MHAGVRVTQNTATRSWSRRQRSIAGRTSRTSICSARTCWSPRSRNIRARRRPVYLPAGADWTDAGSGRTLADGVTVTGAAPLEHIPVFVRGHKEELWRLFQGRYQL